MKVKGLSDVIHELNNIEHNLTLQVEGLDGHHSDLDKVNFALSNVNDALELLQEVEEQ